MESYSRRPLLKREQNVYAQQVRYVYDSFNTALLGTFIGAALLLLIQWPYIDHRVLLSWFAVFILVNTIRAFLVFKFQKTPREDSECVRWGKYFTIGSFTAGAIWAFGAYLSFPEENLPYQLSLAIIIVGLSAGAVSTISVLLVSFLSFALPMMTVIILLFAFEGEFYLTAVLFFILVFVVRGARKIHETYVQNMHLQLEAAEREADLVAARNDAEAANKSKSEFLANMSHELRTPLHGILGFAQFGEQRVGEVENEKLVSYFGQIASSGKRLQTLLDNLLDLSKLESGKMTLDISSFDIKSLLFECMAEQEIVLKQKKITIECDCKTENTIVEADYHRLGQVFHNLLGNAIKFSPGDSAIVMTGEEISFKNKFEKKHGLHISIVDQGRGIPEAELNAIFGKFIQSSSRQVGEGGTGLGLAISKEIIELHQGRIWAENVPEGGASLNFVIPFKQ